MTPDMIIDGLTPEEYEAASSKFAKPGAHLSECGLPTWKTAGKSIVFPFRITEQGEDYGKENEITAGVGKESVWKFKEMEKALGIQLMKNVNGKMQISEADLLSCVGKPFQSVWEMERDTRTAAEGGKGGWYSKPTGGIPVGADLESPFPEPEEAPPPP